MNTVIPPRADPDEWENWIKINPPPDPHALIDHWGGYEKIPEQAWDEFQTAKTTWEDRRMTRLLGPAWKIQDRQRKASPRPQERRPMR